jgi:hypothetical protein
MMHARIIVVLVSGLLLATGAPVRAQPGFKRQVSSLGKRVVKGVKVGWQRFRELNQLDRQLTGHIRALESRRPAAQHPAGHALKRYRAVRGELRSGRWGRRIGAFVAAVGIAFGSGSLGWGAANVGLGYFNDVKGRRGVATAVESALDPYYISMTPGPGPAIRKAAAQVRSRQLARLEAGQKKARLTRKTYARMSLARNPVLRTLGRSMWKRSYRRSKKTAERVRSLRSSIRRLEYDQPKVKPAAAPGQ